MSSARSDRHRRSYLAEQQRIKRAGLDEKRRKAVALLDEGLGMNVIAERLRVSSSFVAAARDAR